MLYRFGTLTCLVAAVVASQVARGQDVGDASTQIVGKMQIAVGQLKKLDTGKPTQGTQKQIVANLDDLIAQLEQECEACRGRVRADPRKPAPASTIRTGPGGMGDLHAAKRDGKDWGALPDHERDRILQSMTEGFPNHYQRILERYYKRLAQEKPPAAGPDTPEPADEAVPTERAAPAPESKPAATDANAKQSGASAKPAAGSER